jgi:glycosyltransferase involved in cell wall biosynthesis
MATKVCFVGGGRYDRPLDMTSEKKFRAIKSLAELFVIGFSRDLRSRTFTEHAHFYLLPQLPIPVLRYVELFLFGQMLLYWLIVRHKVQVVVAQSPYEGFIAAVAIRLAGFFGSRPQLVVELHGDFEKALFLQRRVRCPRLYRQLMKRLAAYSLQQADLLRAISLATKEQLMQRAPGKAIVQFPAWTDIDTFLQTNHKVGFDGAMVLYVGVLTPLKGVHHLIRAFALLAEEFPNARLGIIGKNENKTYAADLRSQVDELGLARRVHFIGPMPQSELAVNMAQASVLVLPSTSEGLGRVVIEAMATGTPVIGSRVGGIPELVEDGTRGFLIPPCDENALADRIRWLLRNPEKARLMGERGRAFAAQLFSTEIYIKGYERIFEMAQPRSKLRKHASSSF